MHIYICHYTYLQYFSPFLHVSPNLFLKIVEWGSKEGTKRQRPPDCQSHSDRSFFEASNIMTCLATTPRHAPISIAQRAFATCSFLLLGIVYHLCVDLVA